MFTSIMQAIADRFVHNAGGVALVNQQGEWRYGQIAARVQAIADELQSRRPSRVTVFGHKEPDTVAALLACAWCGIAFTMVDSANPLLRLTRIAEMYGTDLVLDGRHPPAIPPLPTGDYVCLSVAALADRPFRPRNWQPQDNNALFYVLPTSGSTGVPKGVRIGYRHFAAFWRWYQPLLQQISSNAGHLNHARLSFDMGLLDLFTCFSLGRPLVMLSHEQNAMPRQNLSLMLSSPEVAVSSWFSTPSFLEIMCLDPRFNATTLPELRAVLVGGEYVPPALIARLQQRFPQLTILHAYGPTETACITHIQPVTAGDASPQALLPLGQPRGSVQVTIENSDGQPLPAGEAGEVVLHGDQVGDGYYPLSHPGNQSFGERNGVRFYRTGDRGWLDGDGQLYLKGRIDMQIKWNGNRIELNEIEAVACTSPQVVAAAILPLWREHRLSDIALFVQLEEDTPDSRQQFIHYLHQHLPKYMIPTALHFPVRLPVNLNGKIDRQALALSLTPPGQHSDHKKEKLCSSVQYSLR